MKKYFSKGFLATFIIAGVFMFGAIINTTTVSAETTSSMNVCQLINLLGTLGVIPAGNVSIALAAMGCSTIPPTVAQPIVIKNVQYSPTSPKVNDLITAKVTISNDSSVDYNTPFKVNFGGATTEVSSLSAGDQITVTIPNAFTFSFPGPETIITNIIYPIYLGSNEGNVGDTFTSIITFSSSTPNTPVATIIGTPTLKLTYDQNNKESLLTANFNVSVDAISDDIVLPAVNTFGGNFINSDNIGYNVRSTTIRTNPGHGVDEVVTNDGVSHYVISGGDFGKFNVTFIAKTSELFAGSYSARLYGAYLSDLQTNLQISPADNASNKVTIIGETSPYINSVKATPTPDGVLVVLGGVRLQNSNNVNISNSPRDVWKVSNSTNGTSMEFMIKAAAGYYSVQVTDSTTGASNIVQFNVPGTPITQSSVTITSPSKRTTVGNTFKASGSCTNYQGNVSVYYYSTQKVSVDALCSSGKWSTDINLYTNALSGTFTLYASLSTGQQATLEVPFKIKEITTNLPKASAVSIDGGKDSYTPGQTIKYSVKTVASDNKVGNPERGFNVQAMIYEDGNTKQTVQVDGVYQSVNATYNSQTNLWDIEMKAPADPSKEYVVDTAFYCSRPNQNLCTENQINKEFVFKINNPANNYSITVLSPNGGEVYKIGDTISIKFRSNIPDNKTPGTSLQLYRAQRGSPEYIGDIVKNDVNGSPYNWTIPNNLTPDLYYIYAAAPVTGISLREGGVSDFSDNYFTISSTPTIACTYTYSDWSECINGTQTRTRSTISSRCDIPTTPVLSQSCTVTPNCTYTYSDWGTCTNGTQTRTYTVTPTGCRVISTPVTPIISQPCTVTPPVVDNDSYCGSKTQRPQAGGCGSKKAQISQARVALSEDDIIEVIKIANYYRSGAKTGANIVTCPVNTNYRVCVENGNDGVGNYILLGVKKSQLNYNYSPSMAAGVLVGFDSVLKLIEVLK
jgi:hypothetical protein